MGGRLLNTQRAREGVLAELFRAAILAVEPEGLVRGEAEAIETFLREMKCDFAAILSVGKAAEAMMRGARSLLGSRMRHGLMIVPGAANARHRLMARAHHPAVAGSRLGEGCIPERARDAPAGDLIRVVAEHPIPGEGSLRAGQEALRRIAALAGDTALLCLISGGASSLLCAPAGKIGLEAKRRTTQNLMRAGAEIRELNTVRKHLSRVKGGRLAEAAAPAPTLAFILSDVVGDPIESIGSGPTCPDPSTYFEAWEVLTRTGVVSELPAVVRYHLEAGIAGEIAETPKPEASFFDRVSNRIIGNNGLALAAAARRAEELGLRARVVATPVTGEAREAGVALGSAARSERDPRGGFVRLSGGETTVTVRGDGRGGRNLELALGFALEVDGEERLALLSAGTDGIDGPTDAAGAWADGTTIGRARALGLDPHEALRHNDSYSFFERLGDLFVTGPTGTNVMDVQLMWCG